MDGSDRKEYQLYDDGLIRNTHLEVVGTESKSDTKISACFELVSLTKAIIREVLTEHF